MAKPPQVPRYTQMLDSQGRPVQSWDAFFQELAKNSAGGGGGGAGTVTSVSVSSANGLAGTVTNPTTTPAIALSTSVTGIVKGNGTSFSAAVAGDFPTLNQNTTGTAANVTGTVAIANGGTGQTTQQAAIDALTGTQSAGKYVRSDGTHATLDSIHAADVPTLNQNTTGTSANVTGTVAIANGGTGQTTQAAAMTALAGTQASGKYLRSDGTNTALDTIHAGDVPTLNQNTTGSAASFTGSLAGDVTGTQGATTVGKINGTSLAGLATGILKNTSTTGVPSIAVAGDFPTLNQSTTGNAATATAPASGSGHGAVTLDSSGHFQSVAPGAAGHVLRSNGTDYVDSAIQAADVPTLNQNTTGTAANVTGTVAIANGGTGQTAQTAAFDALSPATTKGDLIIYNGTHNVRVAVGSDGQVLTADSAQASGLKYASPLTNPMTTSGDIIYGGASGAASRLAGDTSNARKFLRETASSGTAQVPTWDFQRAYLSKTGDYTLVIGDDSVLFNITAAHTATLPTAASVINQEYYIRNTRGSTAALTINTTSAQTVDGRASGSIILSPGDFIHVISDGTNWQALELYETIAMRYTNSAGTSITTTPTVLPFATKVFDTHSAFSAGVFTAPAPGTFLIRARALGGTGTYSQGSYLELDLYKGSTLQSMLTVSDIVDVSNSRPLGGIGGDLIQLAASDTVSLKAFMGAGSSSLVTNAIYNFISIHRVGN